MEICRFLNGFAHVNNFMAAGTRIRAADKFRRRTSYYGEEERGRRVPNVIIDFSEVFCLNVKRNFVRKCELTQSMGLP